MNHFTINLTSNTSKDVFADNSIASFRTLLPDNGVKLEGKWEVALSELVYPSMYRNLERRNGFEFRRREGDERLPRMWIPPGRYHSVREVVSKCHDQYRNNFVQVPVEPWKTSFDKSSGLMSIILDNDTSYLKLLNNELRVMFGFNMDRVNLRGKGPHVGDFPVDLELFHTMFVYINIIETQYVGDVKSPLLRSVPLLGHVREMPDGHKELYFKQTLTVRNFDKLEYRPVHQNTFDTIHLELRNETGKLMPFMDIGRTSATLVFKRVDQKDITHLAGKSDVRSSKH